MIGTLGPEGTYSHRAAQLLGDEIRFYDGVPEIGDAVKESDVEKGVVPIENSIEGSVNATLDVLSEYDLYIVAEAVVDVQHALLAQSDDFDIVSSHPQALAQCRTYLRERYPEAELRSVSSTATGVDEARAEPSIGAIAHPSLGDETVTVIEESIQDAEANSTRFVAVAPEPTERDEPNGEKKTTIVIYPGEDRPGLLHDILGVFKKRGVNLTRIESRPSKRELGDYVFHIDFGDGEVDEILDALDGYAEWVDYLGTYGRAQQGRRSSE